MGKGNPLCGSLVSEQHTERIATRFTFKHNPSDLSSTIKNNLLILMSNNIVKLL